MSGPAEAARGDDEAPRATSATPPEARAAGAAAGLRVAVVLSTATGGTALHAGMLAEGCRRAGLAVLALGPAATRAAFAGAAASVPPPPAGPAASAPPAPPVGPAPPVIPPPPATPAPHGGPAAPAILPPSAGPVPSAGPAASATPVPPAGPAPSATPPLITARGGGAPSSAGPPSRDAGPGGDIPFRVVDISDRPRPARDVRAVLRLRRLLRRARPDVVHAHGLRAGALAALAVAAGWPGRRPALVVTVHNAPPQGRAAGLVYGLLERTCAARADAVLCASADLAARMRQRGARRVAEFDVPAPAAPLPSAAAVRRARADLGPAGRPVVLAVARLAGQKGLDVLLAAATRWQERAPVPLLAIAGEGPLAGELAATARQTGVELALLGQRDDVPALLAAADVVVVPSRWEARALIVQEAMRAGRPVVATRVGGIPDLTGPGAALLVPPDDAGELAAAVAAVLDDAALAARLAAAAQARAAALPGLGDAVTAVAVVYRDAAARRRSRRSA